LGGKTTNIEERIALIKKELALELEDHLNGLNESIDTLRYSFLTLPEMKHSNN
jgi:hypothetical protein